MMKTEITSRDHNMILMTTPHTQGTSLKKGLPKTKLLVLGLSDSTSQTGLGAFKPSIRRTATNKSPTP
jgi:hypothetical protein